MSELHHLALVNPMVITW